MRSSSPPVSAVCARAACPAVGWIDMPRDNEELGRFLEALNRNRPDRPGNGKRPSSHIRRNLAARLVRLKDRTGLICMLALLWGAHWLMHCATRLFFRGFLPARQMRMLLGWAASLNRASLVILRRRQRRRLFNHHAGNDNDDRRT